MNSTTKRLQAHVAHAEAAHYEAEAQAYLQAYCTIPGDHASDKAGILYDEAKDRADALRLASRSLAIQARALQSLEAPCVH